jgi:hypothetical protein
VFGVYDDDRFAFAVCRASSALPVEVGVTGRRSSLLLLAAVSLLGFASPALANSIAPTVYFLPGVLPMTLGLALPASILAAFLERPFVSWAGVREYALWYSLQANFISLIIGYAMLPIAAEAVYSFGPLWMVIALAISIGSEGLYYQKCVLRDAGWLRWGPIIWGNLFSSLVLMLPPAVAARIEETKAGWLLKLEPYHDGLFWGIVIASVVVFVGSFFVPTLLRRRQAVPD